MRTSLTLFFIAFSLALAAPTDAQQAPQVRSVTTGPLVDGQVRVTLDLNRQPPEGVYVTAGTVVSSAATATGWRIVAALDACHGRAQIGEYVYRRACAWLPVARRS